jgi:hypothetical protein
MEKGMRKGFQTEGKEIGMLPPNEKLNTIQTI